MAHLGDETDRKMGWAAAVFAALMAIPVLAAKFDGDAPPQNPPREAAVTAGGSQPSGTQP